ncbi:hypothetical protein CB1_000436041 [Camelus ferus]|nr:hypothetical protein CB1_000436041 [Camelus ferus]
MGPARRLVTIKRSGLDGPSFPLSLSSCLFGRGIECDIRIQLPVVSKQHCKIEINRQEAILSNFSSTNPTQVNGSAIDKPVQLKHGDVITIVDRSFRLGLKNSDKNESPFRRLYESMKLELDVKSEKVNVLQNRRKSGSRSHCTTEEESAGGLEGESPISLVSLKSRLKSSRSPQIKGEQGSSQTGEQRSVEETVQAPKDTRSPGILRTEMVVTKTTTPLRYSQQNSSRRCQSEDLGAVSRRESVSLDQSEGFGAEHKMFTPQKFLPRNQTPIKVENAGSFGNTPEKFSKKRKSIPTSVDNLPTETEMVQQTVPAPLVLQAEGKIQNGFLNKTAGQTCPGAPGPDAADAGSFGDSINKVEGVSLKRRRVSFGGRLRPELFDENLPPNTPLKRGETPKQRRSLVAHTPAVLKKIIKVRFPAGRPQKPTGITDHQFSTGHANSPCTIIIGKAHIERVNGPARPYTMLNSFVFNKPADFSEDLSGENVFPSAQEVPAEPSGKRSASPGRLKINERTVKTPGSVYQAPGAKRETQESEAAPPKAAPSANRCRRCAEPRARQRPGAESASEDAEPDTVEDISGRRLRNAPPPGQKSEGRGKESERFFERCKKNIESKEDSGKMMAVRRSRRASELKWEPTADLTTLMRLQETEFKEDSVDIPSVPQTPARAEEPTDAENRTTKLHWKSPQPDRISSPARTNTQPKTPSRKGDVEEVSALGKPTQTPGDATHTDRGPGDDENINLCKETPKQKQNPAENVTGSKRRPRTPKEKARSLEDLIGFKELFQTPHLVKEPMIDDKTPQIPCKSPRPEPVVMSTSMTRPFKTLSLKAEVQEDLSALRKPTQTPGDTTHSHGGPAGADKDIQMFNETSRQKLDPVENVTGIKRRPRTPKEKVQSLEDLAGFKELFQTPVCTKEPTAVVKTPQMLWISPQPEPNVTPTNRKRQLKTPPQKVDREVELSAPRKSTQTPGETRHSDSELVGDDEHRAFKESPKQKLDSAENVTGSKKRSRTPKTKAPPLEDMTGFKELFQTPHHVKQPMTDDKTPQIPCKSPRPEPVDTPASRKGRLKTAPRKAEVQEGLSALTRPTQTSGDTTLSHRGPEGGDRGIAVSQETPKPKLDSAANVAVSKRRPRTPKEKAPPLEDLTGFKELFQTPHHVKQPMTDDKTPQIPCKSPRLEPVDTPGSGPRQGKRVWERSQRSGSPR